MMSLTAATEIGCIFCISNITSIKFGRIWMEITHIKGLQTFRVPTESIIFVVGVVLIVIVVVIFVAGGGCIVGD